MQPIHRRVLMIFTLIAGLVWIFVNTDMSENSTASQIQAPRQGFLAPDFTLKTLDGDVISLTDLRGQAVLINLWAAWCPPCRAEMPTIQKLYTEYKDQGFAVLAINMTQQDDATAIASFVQDYALTFPVLLDESGNVALKYELRSLPSSFFVGRDGIIKEVVIGGPMAEALLRTRIELILE